MAASRSVDKTKNRRRKSKQDDDNDCASLAWLLNFRLDQFVNVKVPDDEVQMKIPDSPPPAKKPPYTYPELIERALREKGELTVSAIYQWISDRFPFYKANDERWKNSVRHNLSINPHFRKGARASQGAGHLWSLAANAIDLLPHRTYPANEKTDEPIQEVQDAHFVDCPKRHRADYASAKGASKSRELRTKTDPNGVNYVLCEATDIPRLMDTDGMKVIVLDEAAIAAASIIPDQDLFTGSTMFLNPVSTEQVVRECGLITGL